MDDLISRQAAIRACGGYMVPVGIIKALPPAQPEPCEDAVSRKAVIENTAETGALETQYRVKRLPPVTPKQRTGKWILDRSGAYCCSKCMEPCASYVMMKPRDKFCKMCGSRNEVKE